MKESATTGSDQIFLLQISVNGLKCTKNINNAFNIFAYTTILSIINNHLNAALNADEKQPHNPQPYYQQCMTDELLIITQNDNARTIFRIVTNSNTVN